MFIGNMYAIIAVLVTILTAGMILPARAFPSSGIASFVVDGTGVRDLSGAWFFRAGDDIRFKDPLIDLGGWDLVFPSINWLNIPAYKNHTGRAWYRAQIFIRAIDQPFGLLVRRHHRGAQFYINGVLFFESRPFDKQGGSPPIIGKPELIVIPSQYLVAGANALAIRTGQLNYCGGFDGQIRCGPLHLLNRQWIQYLLWYASLIAINFFLSLYFILHYLNRKKEISNIYFAGLSFCIAVWGLGYEGLILWLIDYQWAFVMSAYVGSLLTPFFLIGFLHTFLNIPRRWPAHFLSWFFIGLAVFITAEFLATGYINFYQRYIYTPFVFGLFSVLIYSVAISLRGIMLDIIYARRLSVGVAFFTLTFVIGIFDLIDIIKFKPPIIEGYIAMSVAFASVLASRFSRTKTELEHAHGDLLLFDRIRDDFMTTTAHEFRMPLQGIIGISDTVLSGNGPLTANQTTSLQLIKYSAKRLNSLVDQMLDFSVLKENRVILFLEELQVADLIHRIVLLAGALVGEKPIELGERINGTLPMILGDKNRIGQVLFNLLQNAIRYTAHGVITISASVSGADIIISVRDTGIGISKKTISQLWDPFGSREFQDRLDIFGAGLGLAISKYLVELHGGKIWVISQEQVGSTFFFTLPINPPARLPGVALRRYPIEFDEPFIEGPDPDGEGSRLGVGPASPALKLLIVGDDIVGRRILYNILADRGYRISTAQNADEALDHFKTGMPDLILLDINPPELQGYEIVSKIRASHAGAYVPIIAVIVKNQFEDMAKEYMSGCNDYLGKPVNARELLIRIENQIVIKNIISMEKNIVSSVPHEKYRLNFSLVERSRALVDTINHLTEWENIITEDLRLSKTFLDSLMSNSVKTPQLEYAIYYDPLLAIGGDVYDVFEFQPGRVRIFLADATGHGINASLNSITIMSEYNLIKEKDLSPSEIIRYLNEKFCDVLARYRIVFTCCVAEIDCNRSQVKFAGAGHPVQLFFGPGKEMLRLKPRGAIIGFRAGMQYEEMSIDAAPGSFLFLFTDGIIEDIPPANPSVKSSRFIKDANFLESLIVNIHDNHKDLYSLCHEVKTVIKGKDYTKRRITDDDITMIALRIKPER